MDRRHHPYSSCPWTLQAEEGPRRLRCWLLELPSKEAFKIFLGLSSQTFTFRYVRVPALPLISLPQPASTVVVLSSGPVVATANILPPWCQPWSLSFHRATFSVEPRVCVAPSTALSLTHCAGSVTLWARSFSWSGAGQ